MADVITEKGPLFLGSRLKRLAERMQGDVTGVAADAGLSIQPAQYPLLATLERDGPTTVGGLAQSLGLSQPTVTRNVARLAENGLVSVDRIGRDQRHKTVALTPEGEAAMLRSRLTVWPRVEAAVRDALGDNPLLAAVAALEEALAERSLLDRARVVPPPALTVHDFSPDLAGHFRTINEQWIGAMFTIEPTDREVLDDPYGRIVAPGGAVLFAEAAGAGIVGTCALQRTGEGQFELTKMGVLEAARGLKVGEFLLSAAIARAHEMGATRLYLLTNRKAQAAIHLYEKLGFVHDADIMAQFGARYARCDVAMLYRPGRG